MQSGVQASTIYMSKFDKTRLVNVFSHLGLQLSQPNELLLAVIESERQYNAWFTTENVLKAVKSIGEMLNGDDLAKWLEHYQLNENQPQKVGLILAGNI